LRPALPTPRQPHAVRRALGAVRGASRTTQVLLAAIVIGLLAAPIATGATSSALGGGGRNPSNNTSTGYQRETEIVGDIAQNQGGVAAHTGGFTTRQSNKSATGGGAIYGCRARGGTEACVAANNLSNGDAFRFQASPNALTVGQIRFGASAATPVDKPPFVTNGTGLVKNLNADAVDGKSAGDLVDKSEVLFAVVGADGAIGANRGVPSGRSASVAATGGNEVISVPFGRDVSACAATASPTSVDAPTLAVSPGASKSTIDVSEKGATAFGFHLQVTC
jgi:hypothetical protein